MNEDIIGSCWYESRGVGPNYGLGPWLNPDLVVTVWKLLGASNEMVYCGEFKVPQGFRRRKKWTGELVLSDRRVSYLGSFHHVEITFDTGQMILAKLISPAFGAPRIEFQVGVMRWEVIFPTGVIMFGNRDRDKSAKFSSALGVFELFMFPKEDYVEHAYQETKDEWRMKGNITPLAVGHIPFMISCRFQKSF